MLSGRFLLVGCLIVFPCALSLWFANTMVSSLFGVHRLSTTRWLSATLIPFLFLYWGLKRKSLSISGAMSGYCVGFIITLANYGFLACLCTFFVLGSKATKFHSHIKRKFEQDFKDGGQRNWIQVLSNSLVASFIAFVCIIECGSGKMTIDLHANYRCSVLILAFLGALSCACGDTFASEFGPVFSSKEPRLITTWKTVPRGTNGGVSVCGILFSAMGGVLVGLSYFIVILIFDPMLWMVQWPVVVVGGFGGLLGSLVDSLLGATLQYSGMTRDGCIVEHRGRGIKHVSGLQLLDNNGVNLASTLITAFLVPNIALCYL